MSDEQQHEGGRKPQTSHASKSHAPKSGHVADSWRELAEARGSGRMAIG